MSPFTMRTLPSEQLEDWDHVGSTVLNSLAPANQIQECSIEEYVKDELLEAQKL